MSSHSDDSIAGSLVTLVLFALWAYILIGLLLQFPLLPVIILVFVIAVVAATDIIGGIG